MERRLIDASHVATHPTRDARHHLGEDRLARVQQARLHRGFPPDIQS